MFERCFPDFHFRQHITNEDFENVDMPINIVLQWFSICSFGKPRFATLCTTNYSDEGRVDVDRKVCVAAIQGHFIAEAIGFWRLLGWCKVDQSFTGIQILFGFHQTSHAKI